MTTIEYPRYVWDEQRTMVLQAMHRGSRAASWSGGGMAVAGLGIASVLQVGWAAVAPLTMLAALAATGSYRWVQRREERGAGARLQQVLAGSGHRVTREQARMLLRVGACWTVDQQCLAADVTAPQRVAVVVVPPRARDRNTVTDGGGSGWGFDSGDCGAGGSGDGGGGC